MTISFIGSNSANANSVAIPTPAVGDLLILHVGRDGSATPPTPPAGSEWFNVIHSTSTNITAQIWAKYAASSSEVSGTWTNATHLGCSVYRSSQLILPAQGMQAGGTAGSGGATAWSAQLRLSEVTGDRWVFASIQHRSTDTDIETAPSGFTYRNGIVGGSGGEFAMFDTNADSSLTGTITRNLTAGTSAVFRTMQCEIIETPLTFGGGGSGIARLINGGLIRGQVL